MQLESAVAESFEHTAATNGTPTNVDITTRFFWRRSFLFWCDNVGAEPDGGGDPELGYAYENWNG